MRFFYKVYSLKLQFFNGWALIVARVSIIPFTCFSPRVEKTGLPWKDQQLKVCPSFETIYKVSRGIRSVAGWSKSTPTPTFLQKEFRKVEPTPFKT